MTSVALLIGGALTNALAFTGSSYLFHRLSADNIDAERKRHDAAIEKLQAAQIEWAHKRQQRIDFINNQLRLERKAENKFTELNNAMREYHEVFGHELPPPQALHGLAPKCKLINMHELINKSTNDYVTLLPCKNGANVNKKG